MKVIFQNCGSFYRRRSLDQTRASTKTYGNELAVLIVLSRRFSIPSAYVFGIRSGYKYETLLKLSSSEMNESESSTDIVEQK